MKKVSLLSVVMLASFATYAGDNSTFIDRDIFNTCAAIAVVAMIMGFVLALMRLLLSHRIRTRLAENPVPETVIANLLQQDPQSGKLTALKWTLIFIGLGIASSIIYSTRPIGIHSLAVLFFCLAASFGAYFLFLDKNGKK